MSPSERRTALALLDLRAGDWMNDYGDHFPALRDLLAQVQDCIDLERNPHDL